MAHDNQEPKEKIVYVGDSRVRKYKKNNVPKDYSAYPGKTEAFVPNFLLKEWMVGAVVLVGFMALVLSHPAPLGYPADPNNPSFIPMPDWYFLFLYQFLKYPYVSDKYVILGAVVIPGLAVLGLLLAPFLDRGPDRRWYKRPVASSLMLLTLVAMIYLTKVSWDHYQETLARENLVPEHIQRAEEIRKAREEGREPDLGKGGGETEVPVVNEDSDGAKVYAKSTCISCHGSDLRGMPQAGFPALRGIGDKYSEEEIMDIIVNGTGRMSRQYDDNINMGLTDEDMNTLVQWLASQKAPAGE